MHYRTILTAACLITLALLLALPAAAQDQPVTLDTLTIELWPEYDQPSMLVIYSGEAEGVSGPIEFTFSLPPDAQFHVAAYIDPQNGLDDIADPEVTEDSVTFASPNNTFRIEFYDPTLDTTQPERSYIYTYPGDYAVNTLTWSVQSPPTAEDLTMEPTGVAVTGMLNLTYQMASVTGISQDKPTGILVKYTKRDPDLTVDVLSQPAEQEEPISPLMPLLVVTALAVIGFGAYIFIQTRRATAPVTAHRDRPARRGRNTRTRKSAPAAAGSSAEQRFCTKCGTQAASAADKFCRKCGAPLR